MMSADEEEIQGFGIYPAFFIYVFWRVTENLQLPPNTFIAPRDVRPAHQAPTAPFLPSLHAHHFAALSASALGIGWENSKTSEAFNGTYFTSCHNNKTDTQGRNVSLHQHDVGAVRAASCADRHRQACVCAEPGKPAPHVPSPCTFI